METEKALHCKAHSKQQRIDSLQSSQTLEEVFLALTCPLPGLYADSQVEGPVASDEWREFGVLQLASKLEVLNPRKPVVIGAGSGRQAWAGAGRDRRALFAPAFWRASAAVRIRPASLSREPALVGCFASMLGYSSNWIGLLFGPNPKPWPEPSRRDPRGPRCHVEEANPNHSAPRAWHTN